VSGPPSVTVIVPVYDEADRIVGTIEDLDAVLKRLEPPHRILILNDGSGDWSDALEQRLLGFETVEIRSSYPNRGKGAVLGDALPGLETDLAVVIDADGEYPSTDLARILEPLRSGEADWVMGSRFGFGRKRPRQYRLTYLANRFIGLWFFLLSGRRFNDLLTGLYGFRSSLVSRLALREQRFSYTPELTWALLRQPGVRLREVPVGYRFRGYAEGKKIQWWETLTILAASWRYRR